MPASEPDRTFVAPERQTHSGSFFHASGAFCLRYSTSTLHSVSLCTLIQSSSIRTVSLAKMVAKIGAPAPQWKAQAVVNGEIKEISLADYKGKYVVFFFYPLDFTFVCPTEIVAYSGKFTSQGP